MMKCFIISVSFFLIFGDGLAFEDWKIYRYYKRYKEK